ncbi:hypothetical protein CIHG_04714, partial [Coccidioides immitis H538.4]
EVVGFSFNLPAPNHLGASINPMNPGIFFVFSKSEMKSSPSGVLALFWWACPTVRSPNSSLRASSRIATCLRNAKDVALSMLLLIETKGRGKEKETNTNQQLFDLIAAALQRHEYLQSDVPFFATANKRTTAIEEAQKFSRVYARKSLIVASLTE